MKNQKKNVEAKSDANWSVLKGISEIKSDLGSTIYKSASEGCRLDDLEKCGLSKKSGSLCESICRCIIRE